MRKLNLALLFCSIVFHSSAQSAWQPASLQLPTRWSKLVSPTNALPEYPRREMVRGDWQNLNGLWDFAITDSGAGRPDHFDGQILVPYPLESALSGVKKALLPNQHLWYRRMFDLPKKETNSRYLLHFGAVDFQAAVYVNRKNAGMHMGGYQEFTLDITERLMQGNNELTVVVLDQTDKGNNPKGKETLKPQGIMYTATSGIWQTVWLERVPRAYIRGLYLTPDVDNSRLSIRVDGEGAANKDYGVEVIAYSGPAIISRMSGSPDSVLQLPVDHLHLWSPDDPFLYDLSVRLLYKGKAVDTVRSYFGMRKIEIKKDPSGQERIF